MLSINGVPDELENIYSQYKDLSKEIFALLRDGTKPERISSDTCLFKSQTNNSIVCILEGYFKLDLGEKNIRLYSESDFVDLTNNFAGYTLSSEFACEVAFFDRNALLSELKKDGDLLDLWLGLSNLENKINISLAEYYLVQTIRPAFEMQQFKKGETILKEGDQPMEILEMIEGQASVFHNDQNIGEISAGEIFGEIGFLTDTTRSATVVANSRCVLRVVGKEDFLALVKTSPELGITISKNLARRIIALNKRFPGAGFR